ncbi:hybrid sensor histidine kinase/response regulator [Kaistia nematophila]|uniref:Sensory/regulatory protein RpfC n=1 Tax=Kaistia nematophila TaxID=2994654 RepID=A0A9X3DZZ5_9HYPH|nr:response regulator [Kaistia nematophila]MCX5568980.1 response regulator [Kaistia nematophila]
MAELDRLRHKFGLFLVFLMWIHVPVIALVAWSIGRSMVAPTLVAALLALAMQVSWTLRGPAPVTRYVSAVALMGQPALFVFMFSGHPWQMDMHMYFFATLALVIGWCDWRPVIVAAVTVAVHHLMLNLVFPYAVFPLGADLERVSLHAAIVAFQTVVLVWLSMRLVASFQRIEAMSAEIVLANETLEQKVADRTREANAANIAKSLFLANMSHEIRTPMNAILGFSHLALRTDLTPKQADYINKIKSASTALLALINDILDFSKIEAGMLSLEGTHFKIRETIENATTISTVKAAEKGVDIRINIDDNVPATLLGDALRLNQIILNLVSNAVKFTERGAVVLSIRTLEKVDRQLLLEVSVRDTGIGMTPEQQQMLFRSFSQADSSMTRKFGGTGLGLAISKQLVELMGGTIRVDSIAGAGSTFTFTVRLEEGDTLMLAEAADVEKLRGLRVLIADDNPASREILHTIFEGWSVQADLVASGTEAIALLENAQARGVAYDLMLIDWKMPGMDGIEAVEAMRSSETLTRLPTIMMVSAYAREEAMQNASEAGISAFLVKPIDASLLLTEITQLLGQRTGQERAAAPAAHAIPMVAPEYRGSRVLLVEDNEINSEVASEILSDGGLVVELAENGRIACDMVLRSGRSYDVVLMDVQMPEMDGIEATKRIRQAFPSDRLPIIAMTAHAYEQERQNCFQAGMNDHVAKPVDPATLMHALERWLKPRRAEGSGSTAKPAEVPAAADLPAELPPFDLATALVRVNGKTALLRKLIVSFGTNYRGFVATLRGEIDAGALDDARRLAHSLKGVSASLELRRVSEASRQLEDAIAHREMANVDELIERLDAVLQPAIAAARTLSPAEEASAAAPAASLDAAARDEAAKLLYELRQQLSKRSMRARKTFEALEARLQGTPEAGRLAEIRDPISRLDFNNALAGLDAIERHFVDTREVQN